MKTKIEEINRNIYDIKNKDEYDFKIKKGLTPEIIEEISKQKNDPDWMREFRLKALEVYNKFIYEMNVETDRLLSADAKFTRFLKADNKNVISKSIKHIFV